MAAEQTLDTQKHVTFDAPEEGISMFPHGNDPQAAVSMIMDIMKGNDSHRVTKTNCLYPDHVFLDSCSNFMQMVNCALLTDVHESDSYLFGSCNAGMTATKLNRKFGDIKSWLNACIIVTIVSIPVLKKLGSHITYDSNDDYWLVTKNDASVTFCKDE